MTFRFRYRREWLPDDELLARCNALGEEGWSLLGAPVWVPPQTPVHSEARDTGCLGSVGVWRCFFSRAYANKRTVSTREQVREVFSLSPEGATS